MTKKFVGGALEGCSESARKMQSRHVVQVAFSSAVDESAVKSDGSSGTLNMKSDLSSSTSLSTEGAELK